MKNKLKRTTSMLCALTVAAVPMTMSAFTASATEITNTVSDYTLTIPSSFTVANAGWNEIEGGVKASGTLADGKKLVVTAQSDNGWALRSGDNSIGYNLAKENADYNANAEAPTWEFYTLAADGVSQTAGLIVDNYDEAPAGNYSDNVVFTASVEDAVTASKLSPLLENGGKLKIECTYMATDADASYASDMSIYHTDIIIMNDNGEYRCSFAGDNESEFIGYVDYDENIHILRLVYHAHFGYGDFHFLIDEDECDCNTQLENATFRYYVNDVDVSDDLTYYQ
ncbi:hypothetical protein [Ruminococcus sp.]|uniref:hypothetical protein n=1 Tax=Ruminococcus sp. TaxID=41978 RepID=UPI001B159951|nr:hypothetical protein [Ruminococcus sp.]MBO5558146.1 hypothetical protein [Ruminococcus sp.]